ncbi:MAG: hypothetical protein ACRD0J_08625 [Acidimicrobiales bacterium]
MPRPPPPSPGAALAAATGLGRSTVSKALAQLESAHQALRTPTPRTSARKQPDLWAAVPPSPPTPTGTAPRWPLGGLRREVVDWLADHPAEAFGPTAVAKVLGASSGAVANCLARLAEQGWAEMTSVSPRRYRWRGSLDRMEGR